MADAQQPPKIELHKKWKEKEGNNIVEVIALNYGKIKFRDINGADYGVEAEMVEAHFRKKYTPYAY